MGIEAVQQLPARLSCWMRNEVTAQKDAGKTQNRTAAGVKHQSNVEQTRSSSGRGAVEAARLWDAAVTCATKPASLTHSQP
jgi:hypothetical protein